MFKKGIACIIIMGCLLYMAGCRIVPVNRPGESGSPEPAATPVATSTPVPDMTPSPTPSPTPLPTPSPTPKPTPSPTAPPTPSPTPTATPQPSGSVQVDKLPIYSVAREDKVVALSFDASWGATYTLDILDTLDAYGAKATFFLVGFWVEDYPDMVQEIANRGYVIGNHSETHPHMSELNDEEIVWELKTCQERIDALIGRPETLVFRPPYGDYDEDMVRVCAEQGYYTIQWDVDSIDWKGISADEIVERVLSRVGPGSIVLMHNEGAHTPEALPRILEELSAQGYSFVTIPELIYRDNYRIDRNGRQHPLS